jgi:hypothetical protein
LTIGASQPLPLGEEVDWTPARGTVLAAQHSLGE